MALLLMAGRGHAQQLTLAPAAAGTSPNVYPSPTTTNYQSGSSGASGGTFSLTVTCPNGGNGCAVNMALAAGFQFAAVSFTHTFTSNPQTGNNIACTVASGAGSPVTLNSTTSRAFLTVRKGDTCVLAITFQPITGLSYTNTTYRATGATPLKRVTANVNFTIQ